ncbi:MAG: FtsW/RodA/SpoVE family cell cycle protein [Anaerolineales bacterium]|nr:FtsW/RodA/SpoVE family cell cycle protein [Anaerolineales bacterium]
MKRFRNPPAAQEIERRLLLIAASFVFLLALALTLSPAARERSWDTDYRLSQWAGFGLWLLVFGATHIFIRRRLPDADPYLLPLAALLTGWGLMTIWRLEIWFGVRQALWLTVSGGILILGLWLPSELRFLRRYKYILLTGGLLLTALTLVFGTNPLGNGPRLWLGCCGLYFQPSEPLKLLLVAYLAAYMAGRMPLSRRLLPILAPTAFVTGLALLLLLVQRDLGTASIFLFLYTVILYVASGRKRLLGISLAGVLVTGLAGYFLFDVVRLRVDAWINPWLDPTGRSYQIVQSLLAIANGGIGGRGPGLGSPGLVPVSISDFAFAAIAEETGLVGTLGLLTALGFLLCRGMCIALRASDRFRRLLAVGLTSYLGVQAILIIGGNLRLLPLTGVTLPFVSYGGSSMLTSFLALLLLLLISSQPEDEPAPLPRLQPYLLIAGLLGLGLLSAGLINGYWAVVRGPDLLTRTDNARRSISDIYVYRGALLDRSGSPITLTIGRPGDYQRAYLYPDLSPISGYTHPVYGQAGLEASLDRYLRGVQGNPASRIWWDHLLYGQPPPGLDVRLSIDLVLQERADTMLGNHRGAIVMLNAQTGEILVMASHPTYDPALLDDQAMALHQDNSAPLVNRAVQGQYPVGAALLPFQHATGANLPLSEVDEITLYSTLGFYDSPVLRLQVTAPSLPGEDLRLSPLQMALAAAALSSDGIRPAPRLAMAVRTPQQGWVILPALSEPVQALQAENSEATAQQFLVGGEPFWQWTAMAPLDGEKVTWSLAGTFSAWQGTPLAVVVLLEEPNPGLATHLAQALLEATLQPR